jgi:hypothetical protein
MKNVSFAWVEIRLYTEFQVPGFFRSAVVGLNHIQAGGGAQWALELKDVALYEYYRLHSS